MLIDAVERWAKDIGCAVFCVCSTANIRPDAVGRLYRRRGYAPFDYIYGKAM